jgi:UDP-N-acetyl-2-amino-2-deoxyglucuronate dehydrogenase
VTDEVRFGIVGPGKVARLHARALDRLDGARLVAVAGRNEERTKALADPYAARADRGLVELLDRGGVDAVILCTPHPLHRDDAIAAARAGLHVVVEKPMALTPEDCDAMIEAARDSNVILSVISQRRWYPACRRVKAAIDERRIGDPIIAVAEVLGWRGPEYYAMDAWRGTPDGEGGGVLVNQAVHQLDLLTWFMGPAVDIQSVVANLNHPELEVEDTALAVVRFAGGAVGSIIATNSVRPGLHARVHVHGATGASVGVETDRGSSFIAGLSEPTLARNDLWTVPSEEGLPAQWAAEDEAALAGMDVESHFHELQLADIVSAIRDGRPPAVDGEAGKQTVELMAGIYRAAAARSERTVGG